MPQFGIGAANTLNSNKDTLAHIASPPGSPGAIRLPPPMLSSREGCTLALPHRGSKTNWQVRTRRRSLLRFVCNSRNLYTVSSWSPPVCPFFLALPKCRMRGHEIDRRSIFLKVLVPFQLFGPNDGPRIRCEHGESMLEGICVN